MHTYRRTGKEENTIFEVEKEPEEVNNNNEDIVDDFSDNSDSGEEKISEATDKVVQTISQNKFLIRAVIMNILYYQSLETCVDTYKTCFSRYHSHFIYWGVYLLIAALIFVNIVINSAHGIIAAWKSYRENQKLSKEFFF